MHFNNITKHLKYNKKREHTSTTFAAQRTDSYSFPKVSTHRHAIYGYII